MLGEIIGLRLEIDDALPERDGVVERFVPPGTASHPATPDALARLVAGSRRMTRPDWTDDPRFIAVRGGHVRARGP